MREPLSDPGPRGLQTLLAELKRRKVFQLAAVYGATAFVVLQVADLSFPRLGLPDWTVTFVLVLELAGFPFALVLAWAYETGPGGLRRTEPAAPGELEAIVAEPRARRWPAGIAAVVGVLLLGAAAAWGFGLVGHRHARYDSIAVLPFTNMSGDPANEYFGDGLAEELLNSLANIPGLKVAARTSAFALKNSKLGVRAIGDTLGVAAVLEGSVRRSEGRVRIVAELSDARTGYDLWSHTYDRPMTELFAVQSAIASEIVDALAIRLSGGAASLARGGTSNVAAYDIYLEGRQKWATRRVPELRAAVDDFEVALSRDSSFALAWSGLADAIDALAFRDGSSRRLVPRGKYAAQRALILDPELAEAWASLGQLYCDFDRDWVMAELALRRALALKPSYASAARWLSDILRYTGRPAEALEFGRRAVELDPLSPHMADGVAQTLLVLERWGDARAAYDHLLLDTNYDISIPPLVAVPRLRYGADQAAVVARRWARFSGADTSTAGILGRALVVPALRDSARTILARMKFNAIRHRDLAALQSAFGDTAAALATLERALTEGDPQLVTIGTYPAYEPLRGSPRFQRIVHAYGLPIGYRSH